MKKLHKWYLSHLKWRLFDISMTFFFFLVFARDFDKKLYFPLPINGLDKKNLANKDASIFKLIKYLLHVKTTGT